MKKYISILLVAVMLLTLMVPVMAAGVPYLSVSGAKANAGEEVTVNISLNTQNTAIRACSIKVSYSSGLTLTGFSSAQDYRESVAEGIVGFMFFASSTADVSFTATFKVDANAESGDYYVSASIIELIGEDYENISANPGTGTITVHGHTAAGDWNKDSQYHWHTCSCGQIFDKEDHVPQTGVPATDALYCSICGYKLRDAQPVEPEHVCDFGAWTKYSTTQHIRVCKTDSTHVVYADHNYVDGICTDCGYEQEVENPDDTIKLSAEDLAKLLLLLRHRTYNITATAGEGGMITPAGTTKVKYRQEQTYVITPAVGYMVESVVVDGKNVGAIREYTFKDVRAKHTITATFKMIPWINPFNDVTTSDWFYNDVACAYYLGLMNGTASDAFSPYDTATRAQIVTTLWRAEGKPVVENKAAFTDVEEGMWYTDAIAWAAENKIVEGYGDGIFAPGDAITREQIVAILHRYAEYKKLAVAAEDEAPDAYDHSDWAADNVDWAHENGIFAGIGKDITDLTENATRAEIASYLTRFCLVILA